MTNKVIPDYAKDYKNEYLFITGIDRCFGFVLNNLKFARRGIMGGRAKLIKKKIK